jgi:glycosyltransferase involved in cell wall biosynthesis
MKPEISVIMSVYNGETYLKEAVNSVINQTYKNWELIIINDCSTDSTGEILAHFALKDERIRLLTPFQHHPMCNRRYAHSFFPSQFTEKCPGGYKQYSFPFSSLQLFQYICSQNRSTASTATSACMYIFFFPVIN